MAQHFNDTYPDEEGNAEDAIEQLYDYNEGYGL